MGLSRNHKAYLSALSIYIFVCVKYSLQILLDLWGGGLFSGLGNCVVVSWIPMVASCLCLKGWVLLSSVCGGFNSTRVLWSMLRHIFLSYSVYWQRHRLHHRGNVIRFSEEGKRFYLLLSVVDTLYDGLVSTHTHTHTHTHTNQNKDCVWTQQNGL